MGSITIGVFQNYIGPTVDQPVVAHRYLTEEKEIN